MLNQNNPKINKASDFNQMMENLWREMDMDKKLEKISEAKCQPSAIQRKTPKLTVDFIQIAQDFIKNYPLYYDETKSWWSWNGKTWEMVDETHIARMIVIGQGFEDVISKSVRERLFEALKIVARGNKPNPLPNYYLCFKNCLYDLQNDVTIKPTSSFFITTSIPWKLGTAKDTPTIDRFFKQWVGEEHKQTLYEIVSYCLFRGYPIHRFFILFGPGSNGKGTFINFLKKFLGSKNITASELELLITNTFETANLYQKLACFIAEINYNTLRSTSKLKQLTGEDPIRAQFKYKKPFEFVNYAKIIIATNTIPPTTDKTFGFYRRSIILNFPNQFEKNFDILSSIPEEEYENLALKCIPILKNLLKNGTFKGEGTMQEKALQYEELSNPLSKFLKVYCEDDPNGFIPSSELYTTFQGYLVDRKLRKWTKKEIAKELKEMGYERTQKRKPEPVRGWLGLRWRNVAHVTHVTRSLNNFSYIGNLSRTSVTSVTSVTNKADVIDKNPSNPPTNHCNSEIITIDDDFSPEDVEPVEEQCI